MSMIVRIDHLERLIRGWKIRAETLRKLHEEKGWSVTLEQAENAEKKAEEIQKKMLKARGY